MVENRYHLQAHLYSVALDLFLAQRLRGYDPASHFGGVFYVFVRGLDPEDPRRGVHFERPAEGFLRELRQCLLRQTAPSP
jgi:exodeoxyribonuclease V beta subunit